jgi:hypothetical protein
VARPIELFASKSHSSSACSKLLLRSARRHYVDLRTEPSLLLPLEERVAMQCAQISSLMTAS